MGEDGNTKYHYTFEWYFQRDPSIGVKLLWKDPTVPRAAERDCREELAMKARYFVRKFHDGFPSKHFYSDPD